MIRNHQVILNFLNRRESISYSNHITYSYNQLSSYSKNIAEIAKNDDNDGYEFLLIINNSCELTTVQKKHLAELLAFAKRKDYKNVYKIVYTTKAPESRFDFVFGSLKKLL